MIEFAHFRRAIAFRAPLALAVMLTATMPMVSGRAETSGYRHRAMQQKSTPAMNWCKTLFSGKSMNPIMPLLSTGRKQT
jgi:hypothetical protein